MKRHWICYYWSGPPSGWHDNGWVASEPLHSVKEIKRWIGNKPISKFALVEVTVRDVDLKQFLEENHELTTGD